jgi:N-formylglutamate deformylase
VHHSYFTHTGKVADKVTNRAIKKPLLVTIPHSGERVPPEATWLEALPETLLMFDVDRFVDRLYQPIISELEIASVKTEWHRYAVDLNRLSDDVDEDSVVGHKNPSGKFPRGLHWVITTAKEKLMPKPMTKELHDLMVQKYFEPFHESVRAEMKAIKFAGAKTVFHIDAHSMPSVGTSEHKDPGERRADAVISDCGGKSCSSWFRDLVVASYEKAGFKVRVNWPYVGGRVTETYGKPTLGQESIQVELNRALYMNEATKRLNLPVLPEIQSKIASAIKAVHAALPEIR